MEKITGKEKSWTHWFEIPATDFSRAKKFYETVFDIQIEAVDFGGFKMGIFPHKESGAAICEGKWYKPGADGVVVYMNAGPDLSVALGRIEQAGGKVIMPKKQISPQHGFMALFIDSEGNRVALHSMT